MTQKTGAETIRWKLDELFSGIDDPAIETTLNDCHDRAAVFVATYKGQLHTLTPDALAQAYREIEDIQAPLYRLGQYVNLLYAVDTADENIKALLAH